jgi:uncharacterized protein (UPF0332 family)
MNWNEIGKNHLLAAQLVRDECPRSCVSRAYYSAHAVLAQALTNAGWKDFGKGRQTPAHDRQQKLIGQHLSLIGPKRVRELKALIWRLYAHRIDADYRRGATVDRSIARDSIRDALSVFLLLGIR